MISVFEGFMYWLASVSMLSVPINNFVWKIEELWLKMLVSENYEVNLALKLIPALAFKKIEEKFFSN